MPVVTVLNKIDERTNEESKNEDQSISQTLLAMDDIKLTASSNLYNQSDDLTKDQFSKQLAMQDSKSSSQSDFKVHKSVDVLSDDAGQSYLTMLQADQISDFQKLTTSGMPKQHQMSQAEEVDDSDDDQIYTNAARKGLYTDQRSKREHKRRSKIKNEIIDFFEKKKNEEDIGSSEDEDDKSQSNYDDARKMFSSRSIKDHALNSFRKFQEMNKQNSVLRKFQSHRNKTSICNSFSESDMSKIGFKRGEELNFQTQTEEINGVNRSLFSLGYLPTSFNHGKKSESENMFKVSQDAPDRLQINQSVGILNAAGPIESGGISDDVDDGVDDGESSLDNMAGSRH